MCEFSEKYQTFHVSEEQLLSLDDYCEEKYHDPEIQKLGFFKVRLQKDVKRTTSVPKLLEVFGDQVKEKVTAYAVVSSPYEGSGLYASVKVKDIANAINDSYLKQIKSPGAFDVATLNCCTKVFKSKGCEGYLEHFYRNIESVAIPPPMKPVSVEAARNHLSSLEAHAAKLKEYQDYSTTREKYTCLKQRMQTEKIFFAPSDQACKCLECLYTNMELDLTAVSECILYSGGVDETQDLHIELSENFSLMAFCHQNMLTLLDEAYDGITSPHIYVGAPHSFFCVHVEDYSLWSVNFVLHGSGKIWIIIPPQAVAKLTAALNSKAFLPDRRCTNILGHKNYLPNLHWLRRERIPFSVVVQSESEGIVLLPNAAHMGTNVSYNWAQAANFCTKSWVPYGISYPSCKCPDNVHHIELTRLILIYARHLLKPYLTCHDILSLVDDVHFHKSIVLPGQIAPPAKKCEERMECPLCKHTWRVDIRKRNVLSHLNKHHADMLKDRVVVSFLKHKFPEHR